MLVCCGLLLICMTACVMSWIQLLNSRTTRYLNYLFTYTCWLCSYIVLLEVSLSTIYSRGTNTSTCKKVCTTFSTTKLSLYWKPGLVLKQSLTKRHWKTFRRTCRHRCHLSLSEPRHDSVVVCTVVEGSYIAPVRHSALTIYRSFWILMLFDRQAFPPQAPFLVSQFPISRNRAAI